MENTTISGTLVRDPELSEYNGTSVCNFTLRVRTNQKKGDEMAVKWVNCALWGAGGETFARYTQDKSYVTLTGYYKVDVDTGSPRAYLRGDGTPGASFEFHVTGFEFGGVRSDGGGSAPSNPASQSKDNDPFDGDGTVEFVEF